MVRSGHALSSFAALSLVLGGCSTEQPLSVAPDFDGGSGLPPNGVEVCKVGPEGSTASFTVEANGPGTLTAGSSFTLGALPFEAGCIDGVNRVVIWVAASPRPDPLVNTTLRVTEVLAAGQELLSINSFAGIEGDQLIFPPQNWVTVTANYDVGGRIFFKNSGTTTNEGFEGCTPGYWKQTHHFDSWPNEYTPTMQFSAVFADAFPGKTLVQVLAQGGGGLKALGRHTVAALLNTATSGVDYGLSPDAVIAAFNQAFADGEHEDLKDRFATLNERGCPLN